MILQTTKILIFVMVACFALVNCLSSTQVNCLNREFPKNPSLESCITMPRVSSINGDSNLHSLTSSMQLHVQPSFESPQELCGLPCIDDFAAIYNTCNFSPNPVALRKSIIIMQQNLFPTPFFFLKHVPISERGQYVSISGAHE